MSAQGGRSHDPWTGVGHAAPAPAARALRGQLEGLRAVVSRLPSRLYVAAPSRASGSIGAHVRHCLDHVRALVASGSASEMSYDGRLRGTAVETEPFAAVEEIDRLCLELEDVDASRLGDLVRLRSLAERDGPVVHVQTTIGRELAFVIQHTIHHAAIIAVLLEQVGVSVPDDFGYAPSTPR